MNQLKKDVASYAYDRLEEGVGQDQYIEDLHNEIFNTDYFIIGTYKAKQWLGDETFNAIEKIKNYEESNFGQVSTDISDPEKVANMLAYILGEEVLNDSMFYQTLTSYHTGVKLDEHRLNLIKDSLEV